MLAAPYFFYGTLMDPEVLAGIIGRPVAPHHRAMAFLENYGRVYAAGRPYPVLAARPGSRLEGVLVSGLGATEASRLKRYEGADYVRRALSVLLPSGKRRRAWVFVGRRGLAPSRSRWKLEGWRSRGKRRLLRALDASARRPPATGPA